MVMIIIYRCIFKSVFNLSTVNIFYNASKLLKYICKRNYCIMQNYLFCFRNNAYTLGLGVQTLGFCNKQLEKHCSLRSHDWLNTDEL